MAIDRLFSPREGHRGVFRRGYPEVHERTPLVTPMLRLSRSAGVRPGQRTFVGELVIAPLTAVLRRRRQYITVMQVATDGGDRRDDLPGALVTDDSWRGWETYNIGLEGFLRRSLLVGYGPQFAFRELRVDVN